MAAGTSDVWVFRVVQQDTAKPAQGVPVTLLDATGTPAGYWVSDADGTVEIPRRAVARLRLRVGLRNEEPIEVAAAELGEGLIDLPPPTCDREDLSKRRRVFSRSTISVLRGLSRGWYEDLRVSRSSDLLHLMRQGCKVTRAAVPLITNVYY